MRKLKSFLERPVQVTMRMVLMLTLAMLIVTLGTAFNLKAMQLSAHQRCEETVKRAAATAPALKKVVAASRADGDKHMADFWQQYLDAASKNPIPKC